MKILLFFLLVVGKLFCSSFDDFMPLSREEMEQIARQTAYNYFHPSTVVQPKVTRNSVIVQRKVRHLFPDKMTEKIIRTDNRLFTVYDDYRHHLIYQYRKHKESRELEKSFLLEDTFCTEPVVNEKYLALYCRDKKNLYLIDLDNNRSKSIRLKKHITDLVWYKNRLLAASAGPNFTQYDTDLKIVGTTEYPYENFPIQVTKNINEKELKQAAVSLKRDGYIVLAVSRYYAMLLDADTMQVLDAEPNFFPLGIDDNRTSHIFHSWSDFFRDKRRYGMFVGLPDDFWIEHVGGKVYANILHGDRLVIWQWPKKKEIFETNIVIFTYDTKKRKIEQDIFKRTPLKYVGSFDGKRYPIALFYTSKGFQPVIYDDRMIFIRLSGYHESKNLSVVSFYYNKPLDKLSVYTKKTDTDKDAASLGRMEITYRNNRLSFDYFPHINEPLGYLHACVQNDRNAYALLNDRIVSFEKGDKRKEVKAEVSHPWGMKRSREMMAVYGTGKGYSLAFFDRKLHKIFSTYLKNAVKDIACSKETILIATDTAVAMTHDIKSKSTKIEDLSKIPDDCMVVGFVKNKPFYVVSKNQRNFLVILDKKETKLPLDFFAKNAKTNGSNIALGDGKDIALVAYASEPKIVSRWKGSLIGWWKDGIIYLNKGAIYHYATATKKHKKLLDFDPRKYQGKVVQTYVDKDSLVFVMSDMYRIVIDLNTKQIQTELIR